MFRSTDAAAVAKIDKVERNAHLIMVSRNSSLEQVPHAKIPTDCVKVALLTRRVRTRALIPDHFHSGKLCQITGDLILHSNREIGVLAIRTEIFEWQNRDRSFDLGGGFACVDTTRLPIAIAAMSNAAPTAAQRESPPTRTCFGAEFCVAAVDRRK